MPRLPGEVWSVAVSDQGLVVSGGQDEEIRLWRLDGLTPVEGKAEAMSPGHTREVRSVCFSPDGRTLASGGLDGTVRLWDVSDERPRHREVYRCTSHINQLSFSPDGKWLGVSVFGDALVWDLSGDRVAKPVSLSHGGGPGRAFAFAPDGRTAATSSLGNDVHLWRLGGVKVAESILLKGGQNQSRKELAFSPDGKLLAGVIWDGRIQLWDVATLREVNPWPGRTLFHSIEGRTVCFSADGQWLYGGTGDGTVKEWPVRGESDEVRVFSGKEHEVSVNALARTKAGDRLATSDGLGRVVVWDTNRRTAVWRWQFSSRVNDLAFSADGLLAVAGSNGVIYLLRLPPLGPA